MKIGIFIEVSDNLSVKELEEIVRNTVEYAEKLNDEYTDNDNCSFILDSSTEPTQKQINF